MRKGRKLSGGKYKKSRKKKLYENVNPQRQVRLGKIKRKQERTRSAKRKILLSSDVANLLIGKKTVRAKINSVLETPSDKFLARRNLFLKGAIISTEKGKARITNRPSQEGFINAVLVEPETVKK